MHRTDIRRSPVVAILSLTLFSAVLFMLSFPNPIVENGVPLLGAIAVVPAFFAAWACASRAFALFTGAIFGIASTVLAYFWLANFQEYSAWTLGGTSLGYLMEYAIVFAVLRFIMHNTSDKWQALCLALAWNGYEYLKSIGFLGFPWTLLAQSAHEVLPLMQIANITGVWGLSFLFALCNALIFVSIRRAVSSRASGLGDEPQRLYRDFERVLSKNERQRVNLPLQWLTFFALVAAVLLYGWDALEHRANRAEADVKARIPILLVQQNTDSWAAADLEGTVKNLELIINQTREGIANAPEKPKLIVWSETSLPIPYQPGLSARMDEIYRTEPAAIPFAKFLATYNVPLLTGTVNVDPNNAETAYNTAALIRPDGSVAGTFYKRQLVPFAEYVPFSSSPIVQKISNAIGITGTWTPGASFAPIVWDNYDGAGNDLRIGTPICFEDSFPYATREMVQQGADMLINLTNVSWSRSKSAQIQQLAAAKFRSIETGVPLIRGTNSGVTSVVDPWGAVVAEARPFSAETLFVNVTLYDTTPTLYMRIGDAFAQGVTALALLMLLAIAIKKSRDRSRHRIRR